MKKLSIACCLLLTMILSLGLSSCSNDKIKDWSPSEKTLEVNMANVKGVWKYTYYDYTTVADDYVVMTLNEDGTMSTVYYDVNGDVKTITSTGEKAAYTGTWSLSGNTLITVDSDGNTATAQIKWVTETSLYVVLPVDTTTGLTDQMMVYTRLN